MNRSFHGRTLAAVTATGQPKYKEGFGPLPVGFKSVNFNDLEALKSAITEQTIAVMLEPVQGEGGIHVAGKEYLASVRKLCDEKNLLLIFDEVQTGMGRTGEMFAFKHYSVQPDLMILAKALGGGLPIGALIARTKIADIFKPGMHASTFGGSPLVCKAALGVFKAIQSDKMLKNSKTMGTYLRQQLEGLKQEFNCIKEIRGLGLMIGIELSMDGKPIVDECFANGLIINCTQGNVLRVMPALNVTKRQIHAALKIIAAALTKVKQ
jgi:acetylornithine/succinyldiaminopimelate/putrescine aminotransferase